MLAQGQEEIRIDDQLFLVRDRQSNSILQLLEAQPRRGVGELHRSVKHRHQAKMPNVADEHTTARRHQLDRVLQNLHEIIEVREILHD